MKTMKIFACVFFVCVACSCSVGLGGEVDMTAPRLSILAPELKQIVGNTFVVSGTASDKGGVTFLSIVIGSEKLVGEEIVYTQLTKEWRNVNGLWQKKTGGEWRNFTHEDNRWSVKGESVSWQVSIDLADAANGSLPQDGEYTITIEAIDGNQNKNANSVQKVKIVYDNGDPQLAVINPPLEPLKDDKTEETPDFGYTLRDASCLDKLLNEVIELDYQIDDDFLSEGRLTIQFTNAWTDEADKIVYYELDTSTTRRKTIYVTEDDLKNVPNVDMTPMLVRTVLKDDAGNTEEKDHGWFVWCPKADLPWVVLPVDNGDSLYAGDVKTGQVFDDDGANNTVEYTIYTYDKNVAAGSEVEESKIGALYQGPQKPAITNGAWSFNAPADPGTYCIEVTCADESGTEGEAVWVWWTLEDVANPQIESFEADPSILGVLTGDDTGDILLKGVVNDDTGIKAMRVVWIDPAYPNATDTAISFIDSNYTGWENDPHGSAVYKLWKPASIDKNQIDDAGGRRRWEFSLKDPVNIFTDLLVDGETHEMAAQTFFVMAEDTNGNKKVSKFVFPGDTKEPVVAVTRLVINNDEYSMPYAPVIPAINKNDKVRIEGTWSDDSWSDPAKFKNLSVTWNGTRLKVLPLGGGAWSTETGTINDENSAGNITETGVPVQTGGLVNIGVSLTDYAGNVGEGAASVTVASNDPMLFFISADQPNGVYAPGAKIDIFLEFNTLVVYSNSGAKLKLNTGGYADYNADKTGAGGQSKHYFEYTVALNDNEDHLTIEKIEGTANGDWKSADGLDVVNMGGAITNLSGAGVSNLSDKKSIKLDSVKPMIQTFSTTSAEKDYGIGGVVFINATFTEPVVVSGDTSAIKLTLNAGAYAYVVYESSSQDVIRFSYTVGAGENADKLAVTGIDGGGVIKDAAGNEFSIPTISGTLGAIGKTIVIDTTPPGKPDVEVFVGGVPYTASPSSALYADSLTIRAKRIEKAAGTVVEYSAASASAGYTWQRYMDGLSASGDNTCWADVKTIAAYGTYKIAIRQTDSAGNVSSPSNDIVIEIAKPDFLTRVGTTSGSGEYSSENHPSIQITLSFNRDVEFPGGPATFITLNAKDASGVNVKAYNASGTSSGRSFVFTYTANAGDYTPGEPLKVIPIAGNTIFSANNVRSNGADVTQYITLPAGNSLENNVDIRIIKGRPVFYSLPTEIASTSEPSYGGGEAEVAIVFATNTNNIYPGQGHIVFTPVASEYRIPASLPEARYKALFDGVRPDGYSGARALPNGADFYEPTVNGADSSYIPDTSAKYVLKFNYNTTDEFNADLKEYMRRKEAVKVPAYATRTVGKTLTVPLRDSYALPVKGISYTCEIPAGFVKDDFSVGNDAVAQAGSVKLKGIEKPVIRINKSDETITGSGLERQAAQPLMSQVKIDCRTPGVTINYEMWYASDPVRQYLLAKEDETTGKGASYNLIAPAKDVKDDDRGKYGPVADASGAYTLVNGYLRENKAKPNDLFIFTNNPYPNLSAIPSPVSLVNYSSGGGGSGSSSSPITFVIGSENYADGGMKYRIHASIGGSVHAYEIAYRTVVVFNNYRGAFSTTSAIDNDANARYTSVGKTYSGREFSSDDVDRSRMWVRGGDATRGTVSIAGFPISWDEREKDKVRLMSPVDHTPYLTSDNPTIGNPNVIPNGTSLYGTTNYETHGFYTWYWVTWKMPATAYLGFLRGAMKDDTATTPYKTSWAQNGFSRMTEYYAAYPGETRVINTRVPPAYSANPAIVNGTKDDYVISGITSSFSSEWNSNRYYVGGNDVARFTFGTVNGVP